MDGGRKATYRNGNGSSSRNSAGGGPGDAGSHRGRNPTVAGECRAVSYDRQIVSPGCTVVCAMEMGTPHTVNHIRAPYRATVQELHVANSWKVTPDGHFAGQCTDGQRTYSVKKGKTIRKGDELLVVYGSYYWQELRRGMGCTQTQCAHNCPFRVNDDETEPAMGDWVQNGVVHREEDGQPTHDTGDVAESAQQSEGQLEQNTRSGGHDSQVLWEGDRSGNRGGLGISDGGHEHKGPFREKLVRDGVPATALDSAEYKQQRWQQLAEASGPPTLVD